jgi:dTDP-4-amino-4,6-dideoxygalactose transaminase
MYASAFPGLSPALLAGRTRRVPPPFPMSAARQLRYHRARNALYQLVRALAAGRAGAVLVPDYHHGNEVAAIRAAGAPVSFYRVDRRLGPDLDAVRRLCQDRPLAILCIHYLGWPQPTDELAALARTSGALLIEDCALALLSMPGGRPLGATGAFSVFCLYKTLPVPNGAVLVANPAAPALPASPTASCGLPSLGGRVAELTTDWLRERWDGIGRQLVALKQHAGAGLTRLGVRRVPVGETGFDVATADLGMSPLGERLLASFDYPGIRRRRAANYLRLARRLAGRVPLLLPELPDGVCPLFLPILVADKPRTARALAARGVAAVEFWNDGDPAARSERSDAAFLRRHVLELPVHQGLDARHVEHIADQVLALRLPWSERLERRA